MLRAGLSLLAPGTFATALPAVQQCLGAAQQCWYATKASKAAPYAKDAQKPPKAKKEKKSDSTKPRALNAYVLFVKDRSAAMKASGSAAEMVKSLSAEWRAMTDADKAPYVNEAAAMKSQIQQEAPPKKPKRAPSAYNIYFKELFPQLGMKVTEAAKEIGAKWKSLPEQEKQRYKDMAAAGQPPKP